MIITDLGEIGENAIIVFEENVGVGAEEIVANQEYVAYTGDSDDVIQVWVWPLDWRIFEMDQELTHNN